MSVIYLKHPRHGAKVARNEEEASRDKAHGWVEFNPEEESLEKPLKKPKSESKPKPESKPKSDDADLDKILGEK